MLYKVVSSLSVMLVDLGFSSNRVITWVHPCIRSETALGKVSSNTQARSVILKRLFVVAIEIVEFEFKMPNCEKHCFANTGRKLASCLKK